MTEGQSDLLLNVRTPSSRRARANRHQDAFTVIMSSACRVTRALTRTFAPAAHLFICHASAAVTRRREHFCRRQTANISENTQMGRQRVATQQKITAKTCSSESRRSSHRRKPLARPLRRCKKLNTGFRCQRWPVVSRAHNLHLDLPPSGGRRRQRIPQVKRI